MFLDFLGCLGVSRGNTWVPSGGGTDGEALRAAGRGRPEPLGAPAIPSVSKQEPVS